MGARVTTLNADILRATLNYDVDTGIFVWRTARQGGGRVGDIAGSIDRKSGYREIGLFNNRYWVHRLVFLHVTGNWPIKNVDHINGIRDDNRFANLRDVSQSINMQNQRRARSNCSSGLLGAYKSGNRWCSKIKIDGVRIHIGTFDSPGAAHAAYIEVKRQLHQGCSI